MKIVIVEDNEKIRNELSNFLNKYGYETVVIKDFKDIVEDILDLDAHLILLDINLPVFDGYYICRELRAKSNIPIIVVTSRDSEVDELMSMNLGADDFITKPYNTQILLARITSLLKRSYKQENNECLCHKGITLNLGKSVVSCEGKEIELSKNELKILHILIKNKDIILSRDDIMNSLWQTNEFIDDNTLTVNVNRLRKKLESIGVNDYIVTKRGQGYIV
ncbi:response regulator transcription factor [Terrisporobacter petrolearius]|uniref:response regulator transcription factor n=1 Tax=Terrisporobacter petrolearius TaxID=1460447 RepID=UPI003B008FAB